MNPSADVIVIGGGHNGLVAACYLAKAGRKVLVLEASETFGGMVSTNPVIGAAPNHRINEGGMDNTLLRETNIVHDLSLESFGYGEIEIDPAYAFLQPDGSSLCIWKDPQKTADEIRRFSQKDARAYIDFANDIDLMMNLSVPYMKSHPIRVNIWEMFLGILKLLRHPRRAIGLSRFVSASHAEYIEESFEHPIVRGPLAAIVPFLPIQQEMTAWMLIQFGFIHRKGVSRIRTGSGGLTDALGKCLLASGGSIRTGAKVEQILVENQRAAGVKLVGGEELRAPVTVAACNIYNTLQQLLPAGALTDRELAQARRIPNAASNASSYKLDIALDARASLAKHQAWRKNDIDLRKCGLCWATYEQHIKAWDACARGEIPDPLPVFVLIPSANDPSQAPEGQDTIWCWSGIATATPTQPWEEIKASVTKGVILDIKQYIDNVETAEIGRRVMSPDDLATRFHVPKGNVYHVDTGMSRFGPFRPAPAFANYTTSVKGLFLSGGSMHPSAGIAGIPGRIAAQTVLRLS
ncbi:MAG: beta-carotene ketolase [Hydrocarboniphaga sp.]|uniref:phytoene desaturase family protein n=1 Tax=Hydrocarboniphaga sp. TaxID=2033016 RepID=UPI00262A9113|nr:NAD(P)/FAD-dependent oxidoreductase [Hydrocarboniphaga sp.]MDB5969658.1 beta-carotene ketolase [Hydrocarboniphaga sp.]